MEHIDGIDYFISSLESCYNRASGGMQMHENSPEET